jgi:hypothetical protein
MTKGSGSGAFSGETGVEEGGSVEVLDQGSPPQKDGEGGARRERVGVETAVLRSCGAETICFGSDFQKVSASAPAPEPAPT